MPHLYHSIFISPDTRHAARLAAMLTTRGDMRGLLWPDASLVLFDSYGYTHACVLDLLGRPRKHVDALIFRKDGGIWSDVARGRPRKYFSAPHFALLRAIYTRLAVAESEIHFTPE